MSCLGQSYGYIDWRILSQQFKRYNVPIGMPAYIEGTSIMHFKLDYHIIIKLMEELESIKNGFQIFYNCLRDTQVRCHGHRILADDLEMETRSETISSYMYNNISIQSQSPKIYSLSPGPTEKMGLYSCHIVYLWHTFLM